MRTVWVLECIWYLKWYGEELNYEPLREKISLQDLQPDPEVIKLSMKFIPHINVKMPTVVGILTYISMMNTTSERLKARNCFICQHFNFYEQLKFVFS